MTQTSDKHFVLTDEFLGGPRGILLYRIRATRDIPYHDVKAGDLGGFVQHEGNLAGNASVSGGAVIDGDARVASRLDVVCGTVYTGIQGWWSLFLRSDNTVKINTEFATGTPGEMSALIASDEWFEDKSDLFKEARPELRALAEFWEVSAARMIASAPKLK